MTDHSLLDAIPVPLALNDGQGRITHLNKAFVRSIGYTRDEIPDLNHWWPLAYPDPEYRRQVAEAWLTALEKSEQGDELPSPMEVRIVCKDGASRIFHASPVLLREGSQPQHLVVLYDVTLLKNAESRIEHLIKIYRALSEVNQAIVRMESETSLFPLVCRMSVDFGGMVLAWVGKLNKATGFVTPDITYGSGADYLNGIVLSADESIPQGRGPVGLALREKRNILVNDYLGDPITKPWQDQARRFGWGSSGTFPILRGGEIFAVMGVYHRQPNAFNEETVALLDEMVRDVSFALESFDRDLASQKAQAELAASERHFRAYFERSMVGMAATSPTKEWLEVNDALCNMLGYSREELLSLTWEDITHPDDMGEGNDVFQKILAGQVDEYELDKRYVKKHGEILYARIAVRAVRQDDGTIDYFVLLVNDITESKIQQRQLELLVHHDPLTGLPNRTLLNDRLEMGIAQANRSGTSLAVCFMDLDGFKAVNDTFGHGAGDLLLVEVSRRLMKISRATDTVGRIGGDEFLLIFSEIAKPEECHELLKRIVDAMSEPFLINAIPVKIAASIGVALYPDDVTDGTLLLRHADQAMYIAKQSGRNRIHFYDASQDRLVQARSEVLSRIEIALEKRELVLHYQPKVNMRNGQVIGLEALLRWQHPDRGLLYPGEFMPLIENSGFESRLSEWVISEAVCQIDAWQASNLDLIVSVNVPASHLNSPGFIDFISGIKNAHPGLADHCLELEILETAALGDMAAAIRKMEACIKLGIRFSIDDFGTGYASLAYLRRLPADIVKIDQVFVRDMMSDPNDLSIVKGVIGLADAFQKVVIAEGVETEELATMLLQLGCEICQGYFIARPMDALQVPDWVRNFRLPQTWAGGLS